jgi:hypothetical protein
MEKIINNLHNKPFSGKDILKFLDNKTKILTYDKLKDLNNINEAFENHNCFVLLYFTHENFGHWTCVIKHEKKIEFFDSYGKKPDNQLNMINKEINIMHNQDYPYLTKLLYETGLPIEYNNYRLQKKEKKNINYNATCGRHVSVRLILKELELDDYIKFIKSFDVDPDTLVTIFTSYI